MLIGDDDENSDRFGYQLNDPRMSRLLPLMQGWRRALNRDAKLQTDDPAYYYNERPNLSLLAAGAWIAGATALEEFSGTKGWGTKKSNGRIDLYVGFDSFDVEIEAKRKYMSAACNDASLRKLVSSNIKSARNDAKKDYGADAQFGCVFFIPRFSKRRFQNYEAESSQLIRKEICRYIRLHYADSWTWCFPRNTRMLLSDKKTSYYPGVIMGVRAARFWRRR